MSGDSPTIGISVSPTDAWSRVDAWTSMFAPRLGSAIFGVTLRSNSSVLAAPDDALASILAIRPDWNRVYTDSWATIFERRK